MSRKLFRASIVASCLLLPACQQGPSPEAIKAAAETITEEDVATRVSFIADDAMGGRDTPSPGLEKTAEYIAAEYERMGLEPVGDDEG